jgi:PKD repeat protein
MVTPALGGAPTCGFTVNKIAGYAPMEVVFRDLSKGESLSGWEWSFGDGGSSMAQNPTYTYRTPGTYTVTLTVANDLGSTKSTRTALIRVLNEGEPMPTVTQAAPPATTMAPATPAHTMPVWTSPQKTATATKQAASWIPTAFAGTGIAAVIFLVLQRDGRA